MGCAASTGRIVDAQALAPVAPAAPAAHGAPAGRAPSPPPQARSPSPEPALVRNAYARSAGDASFSLSFASNAIARAADGAGAPPPAVARLGAEHDERESILHGVSALRIPRATSQLCAFASNNRVLLAGFVRQVRETGVAARIAVPLAVTGVHGHGRFAALGHLAFLHADLMASSDNATFAANLIYWLSRHQAGQATVRCAHDLAPGFRQALRAAGFAVEPLDMASLASPATRPSVAACAVLLLHGSCAALADPAACAGVLALVAHGAGLLLCHDRPLASPDTRLAAAGTTPFFTPDCVANELGLALGFAFVGLPLEISDAGDWRLEPHTPAAQRMVLHSHVGAALASVAALMRSEPAALRSLPVAVIELIAYAAPYLPLQHADTILPEPLLQAVRARVGVVAPSLAQPLVAGRVADRLAVLLAAHMAYNRSLTALTAAGAYAVPHAALEPAPPGAAEFPGLCDEGARPVSRTVSLNTAQPGWQSVGLYAPPNALVRLTLGRASTPHARLAEGVELFLRIGVHADALFACAEWRRHPAVCTAAAVPLHAGEGACAYAFNALGGLVVVDVRPRGDASAVPAAQLVVTIDGAVEAPLFVLGTHDDRDWTAMLSRPAPWGELASGRIVFSLPRAMLRAIRRPGELLRVWDRVLESCSALAGAPPPARPERIVADVQLARGVLHSGYPVACAAQPMLLDCLDAALVMRQGAWSVFRALGHNFLRAGAAAFGGMEEVASMLFPLFVYDSLLAVAPLSHPRLNRKERKVRQYLFRAAGREITPLWQSDPLAGLHMYIQLIIAFGWELVMGVLRSYAAMPEETMPKDAAAACDLWVVRFCEIASRDLTAFFLLWGVPLTPACRIAVGHLPEWLPDYLR